MNTSAFAVSETELLPPCSSTVFLSMGGNRFPFREQMTDHTWNKLVLPFMDSTKVRQLFSLAHLVRLRTSRQASNHFSLFLPIVRPNSASQEVAPLHGSFQRRSHPALSRIPNWNHPHMILGSLKYSLPKKGDPFFQRPPQVARSDVTDGLFHLLLEVFPISIVPVPLQL
jgi:hypothetical protein